MIPANRILMTLRIADLGFRIPKPALQHQSAIRNPISAIRGSPFRRLDQLIDRLGIIERLANRESGAHPPIQVALRQQLVVPPFRGDAAAVEDQDRSEEHTSELQSLAYLVCRLLLEKKKLATHTPFPWCVESSFD